MPSQNHEFVLDLTRNRPAFIAELLRDSCDVQVPSAAHVHAESGELTQAVPVEYRADQVLVFTDPERADPADSTAQNVSAIVLEVQRKRDPTKFYSWPAYLVLVRAQKKCPTSLVVFCEDAAVAEWASGPITIGHRGFVLNVHVIGPGNTPYVVSPEQVRETPEVAALSALAHGDEDGKGSDVLRALAHGYARLVAESGDEDSARYQEYLERVNVLLSTKGRAIMEMIMQQEEYPQKSEFFQRIRREGRVEGRVEGSAEMAASSVLVVLEARGLEIPPGVRERVLSCSDSALLDVWLRRAATVPRAEGIFGSEPPAD